MDDVKYLTLNDWMLKLEGDDEDGNDEEKAESVEPEEEIDEEKLEEPLEPTRKPYLERGGGFGRGRREFRGVDRGFPVCSLSPFCLAGDRRSKSKERKKEMLGNFDVIVFPSGHAKLEI